MHDRGQLFPRRQIHEARQIEREQIEQLPPLVIVNRLDRPDAAALRRQGTGLETQRGQTGPQAVANRFAGLAEADADPAEMDVRQLLQPGGHVRGQAADVEREIEATAGGQTAGPGVNRS